MKEHKENWYEEEFAALDLGDKRLGKRFVQICKDFNRSPQAIISHAVENYHQCKGAYRFWKNDKVTSQALLEAHGKAIEKRLADSEDYTLEIQDSSELNFSSHLKTSELGPIAGGYPLKGLEMHSSIIASEQGLLMGIGSCYIWARDQVNQNKGKNYRKLDWQEKESIKWARAMEEVDRLKIKNRVTVADRESDIFHLLEKADLEERRMIIRLRWNRKIAQSNLLIKEYIQSQPCAGTYTINIAAKGGARSDATPREARTAVVEVRFANVDFLHRKVSKGKQYTLNATVIHAREASVAEGEEPVEWFLISNLPCSTFEEAIRIIRCYEKRWLIEDFHKILKGAIKVEEARLGTAERLDKLIVFLAILACRFMWVNKLSRIDPELPCTVAFAIPEWKLVMRQAYKISLQDSTIPSIEKIVIGIAKLAGYWGRRSDPPPGLIVLWRGWMKLYESLQLLEDLGIDV